MRTTLFATTTLATMLALGTAYAQQEPAAGAPTPVVPEETVPATPDTGAAPMASEDMGASQDPGAMQTADEPAAMPGTTASGTVADTGPILTPVEAGSISADTLMGANIQTPDNENIATVSDVLLTPDGMVENVVAQFGGFLGFGSNAVLLTMDEIDVFQDEAGNIVVQTALTPESLEGRPEYQAEN